MNDDENVEEGEIEESTPNSLDAAFFSGTGGSSDNNFDTNAQSRDNNISGIEYKSSNWLGDYQDRRMPKSEYSDQRWPDGPRNPNGPPLLLMGHATQQPRHAYPRQTFPRDRASLPRGARPPTIFPDKRPIGSPRGINPPRSSYGPSWKSGKPNEYPDYHRNSPSYYGPTSSQSPRHPPPNQLPLNSPLVSPVAEPVSSACGAKSIMPPSSPSNPTNVEMKPVNNDDDWSKPLPLIHVVSDPNLTLESSKLITPKLPPPVPSVNRGVYPRLSIFQPTHSSPTKVNITRLIDQVSTMTNATQLPLGILQDETSIANLPPPPALDGATESTESTSSRSRPRVVWGQGLRRKSSGPVDAEPVFANQLKAEIEPTINEIEPFSNEPPPEKFLDIEEEPNLRPSDPEINSATGIECTQTINNESIQKEDNNQPNIPGTKDADLCEQLVIESPRSKAKPGRPSLTEEAKFAKKLDKKQKKNGKHSLLINVDSHVEPKLEVSRRKSFDETRDSDSDSNKHEETKKRRASSRENLGDSDKESAEDEVPRKKRGRPPAGAAKPGALADEPEKDNSQCKSVRIKNARNRPGRGKSDGEPQSLHLVPPVKRRSRSFGSFERDSLGGLFSSVSDLRNAYYALQGMVRIQVGMRGVSGFNKEDLMGLNQMLQNPQSVVNLPIPYTSEIVMCLEIIEAKSYQYGDAMVAIQLLKRDIEEISRKRNSLTQSESDTSTSIDDLKLLSCAHHPMGLVKKTAIKSDSLHPSRKSQINLWPEPLAQQFLSENMKRVVAADICAHVHFPPSLPNAGNIYDFDSLLSRGRRDLEKNRSAVFAEVRRRKLARTQAWEILADRYVAVKHRWDHYQEKHTAPAEEEVLGPRLRAMSTMRNILGPRAPARLSTMRASSDMLLQDQDKILQQLAMKELMARRLALGVCPIPDMLSPWQNSDSSVPPKPPSWPPKDMYLPDIKPEEKYTCPLEEFPKSVADPPVIIDINGCRLTTDGRRPHCAVQPTSQPCPINCNCALQVDKEERKFHPWSDMEKCIFLDKFMQFPKNFSKIAAFLTNRTTKDCVKFYYDSKTTIPYKSLLREFDNRKRHLRNSWTHSCAAAVSVGGVLYPPDADEKEHIAELPPDDVTYSTFCSHPMHMATALGFDSEEDANKGSHRKRQMAYLQHRPPRERTQLLAARKDLKRECLKYYETTGMSSPPYISEADNGAKLKTFSYPADVRNMSDTSQYYGGYGQNSDNSTQQEGMNTRKKSGTCGGGKDIVGAKDSATDRGRGRGRRGRRPNTASRGTGRVSQESATVVSENNLSPTSRGRGRSSYRGRLGHRGRGRGRGRGEPDESGNTYFTAKDEDEIFESNDPIDEFDQAIEGDYDGGEDDDAEYDQREEEIDTNISPPSQDEIVTGCSVSDLIVQEVISSIIKTVSEEDLNANEHYDSCEQISADFSVEEVSFGKSDGADSQRFDVDSTIFSEKNISETKRKFDEIGEPEPEIEEEIPLKCSKLNSDE